MTTIKNNRKNFQKRYFFTLIGLFIILFVSLNMPNFNKLLLFYDNLSNLNEKHISTSEITNVTNLELQMIYPEKIELYYTEPSNGFSIGTIDNLKNETLTFTSAESYSNANHGKIYINVSFNVSDVNIDLMTLFKLSWEGKVFSTANNPLITKLNVCIYKSGAWEFIHNATNTQGNIVDRKIGWWEHEITSDFSNYVTNGMVILRFEAEQTLQSSESNWYLYLSLYWANLIFGQNVEFVRLNTSSIQLAYNDTEYEQIGDLSALQIDEDGNVLILQLNNVSYSGRNNITFDVIFELGDFYLDDILGYSFYHNDWFIYQGGSPPPSYGTINIQNVTENQFYPIQMLRFSPSSYDGLFPKIGYSGYTITGKWWNTSQIRLRYCKNITGVTNWAKIEIDLAYIEIARRSSPIISVNYQNTTKYIFQEEYVNIYVKDYNSQTTDIRILSNEGETFIGDSEGNYTFIISRETEGWYNFTVQVIDNKEHLVSKSDYNIWFDNRPITFDITLTPIPQEINLELHISDTLSGDPIPDKEFDLLIFRFGETIPYQSYPGLTVNASGIYSSSFSVSPYLDETYTFNITTQEDEKYAKCSAISSVTCDYAPPKFTITDIVYNSEFAGEDVTIYYNLEDWSVNIIGAILKENGNLLTNLPTTPGSNQITFKTKSGNNNYTFWAINERGQNQESEVINLDLSLQPVKMDVISFYLDNFYYFFVNVKDNETGASLDGVPVKVSLYDSGLLMFSGTITTHSVIFGGFPFDEAKDHHFSIRAEVNSENYVDIKREAQIPFQAYPLDEILPFGIAAPIIIGILFIPRILRKRKRFNNNIRYQAR